MTSLGLLLLLQAASVQAPHPFRVEDLQKLRRLNEAVLSPDGRWVAYSVQLSDLKKNKSVTNLWAIPAAGGSPMQLTFADHGSNSLVRWAPDAKSIYFLSNRDKDMPQIFRLSLGGGEASQVTHFAIGVNSFLLSTRWQDLRHHRDGVPGLPGSGLQRKEEEGSGRQSGEGAHHHQPPVPALGRMGGRQAESHLRHARGREETPGTSPRATPMLRSGPKAAARRWPSRPTARRSGASARSRGGTGRPSRRRPTARCPRRAADRRGPARTHASSRGPRTVATAPSNV